jgi:hypothetical protein
VNWWRRHYATPRFSFFANMAHIAPINAWFVLFDQYFSSVFGRGGAVHLAVFMAIIRFRFHARATRFPSVLSLCAIVATASASAASGGGSVKRSSTGK